MYKDNCGTLCAMQAKRNYCSAASLVFRPSLPPSSSSFHLRSSPSPSSPTHCRWDLGRGTHHMYNSSLGFLFSSLPCGNLMISPLFQVSTIPLPYQKGETFIWFSRIQIRWSFLPMKFNPGCAYPSTSKSEALRSDGGCQAGRMCRRHTSSGFRFGVDAL